MRASNAAPHVRPPNSSPTWPSGHRPLPSVGVAAGTAQRVGGTVPVGMLPMLRWREVEVHRVDLGLGATMVELDREYLRRDLRLLEMLWRARRPMGLTPLPAEVRRLAPHERLGWFLGRVHLDGVPPPDAI